MGSTGLSAKRHGFLSCASRCKWDNSSVGARRALCRCRVCFPTRIIRKKNIDLTVLLTALSILFVHGLQGHPEKTWLHESDEPTLHPRFLGFKTLFRSRKESTSQRNTVHRKKRRVFWPRDLLPALCPTCRIMTFGYDTMVTKAYAAADKGNIFSHAKDLLYELDRARVQGRYTIFVAHSLGGIIVKEVFHSFPFSYKLSRDSTLC